jgi:glycosyltransferase involved in cell wall biosynthesis
MHDWLTGFRGGERMLEVFCEMFPEAPLYTLLNIPGSTSPTIENRKIETSFLNGIPGIKKNYRKFLPLFPLAADHLKIKELAEVVLSSSHCVIKGVQKPKGAVHVSYIHSPMRYMYDQYDQYFGPGSSLTNRVGARVFRDYLVKWDRQSNQNVDLMIANSNFVRERIRRFYEQDADVVYPFVELRDFEQLRYSPVQKQDYFVMVTAFAPNKRVDLAIEAFNQLKLPLVIIGSGQLEAELKRQAEPHVRFLGSVNRAEVIQTLASARALIFPGVEDFGIVPLESLASGTPVIALKAGGVLETLTEADTVFFEELSVKSLMKAVREFESRQFSLDFDRLRAFSRERFQSEINDRIEYALAKRVE